MDRRRPQTSPGRRSDPRADPSVEDEHLERDTIQREIDAKSVESSALIKLTKHEGQIALLTDRVAELEDWKQATEVADTTATKERLAALTEKETKRLADESARVEAERLEAKRRRHEIWKGVLIAAITGALGVIFGLLTSWLRSR